MSVCPRCGSSNFIGTVRVEYCDDCGYEQYYPDAHAPLPSTKDDDDEG